MSNLSLPYADEVAVPFSFSAYALPLFYELRVVIDTPKSVNEFMFVLPFAEVITPVPLLNDKPDPEECTPVL